MDPYNHRYCKLGNPSQDLRILEIKKNNKDPLEAELHQLDDQPYAALSWCWRAPDQDEKETAPLVAIHILHNGRPYEFRVSGNLVAALISLRERDILRIWIDWICIDQSNLPERNNQVQLMARIYGEAYCVYVWLGEEKDDSQEAFKFIPQLLRVQKFDQLTKDKTNHVKWKAIKMLMMRDWFSRRWIIQEIALAQEAQILCGNATLDWNVFAHAVSLFTEFETGTRNLSEIMKALEEYGNVPDYFGNVSALSAAHLVEVTNRLFRQRNDNRRERLLNLEYLVSTFTAFNATEARDTIYAILAIAKDTTPQTEHQVDTALIPLVDISKKSTSMVRILRRFAVLHLESYSASKPYNVDYSLPISDIYVEFVRFCIERSRQSDPTRALDIICRPWSPDPDFHHGNISHGYWRAKFHWKRSFNGQPDTNSEGRHILQSTRLEGEGEDTVPSWIPSSNNHSHGWTQRLEESDDSKMIRRNPDSLVGNPSERIYSASGTRGVTNHLRFENGVIRDLDNDDINETHYHSVFAEGFVLGTVEELSGRSVGGQIPKEWATLVEKHIPRSSLGKHRRDGQPTKTGLWSHPASDDFWRTLVGDQSWTGGNPLRFYQLIIENAYTGKDDVDLEKLIHYSKCQPAKDVCRRVHAVIWNRKLMSIKCKTTTSKSSTKVLGLAPDAAGKDDLICILYGCSVPVILRKYEKTENIINSEAAQGKERREREAGIKIKNFIMNQHFRRMLEKEIKEEAAKQRRQGKIKTPAPPLGKSPRRRSTTNHHDLSDNITPPESNHAVFYTLIGECYAHGMMNGEAIDYQNVEKLPTTLFEIR